MTAIANVTFACADPDELATFWASALEYEREVWPDEFHQAWEDSGRDPNGAVAIIDPDKTGTRLLFQKKPKTETESIPIHLDLETEDREATVDRLVELGATEVETKTLDLGPLTETWTVMSDPEGNGFCVQAPE